MSLRERPLHADVRPAVTARRHRDEFPGLGSGVLELLHRVVRSGYEAEVVPARWTRTRPRGRDHELRADAADDAASEEHRSDREPVLEHERSLHGDGGNHVIART